MADPGSKGLFNGNTKLIVLIALSLLIGGGSGAGVRSFIGSDDSTAIEAIKARTAKLEECMADLARSYTKSNTQLLILEARYHSHVEGDFVRKDALEFLLPLADAKACGPPQWFVDRVDRLEKAMMDLKIELKAELKSLKESKVK